MAIVYLDKIKSGIPTTIIEGKDVDSVILIDPDPAMPPFFLANKMTLDSSTRVMTVHNSSGSADSSFNIDASAVEALVGVIEDDLETTNNLAQSAHNIAVAAETEVAVNTAGLAALSVTVAVHGDKIAVHRGELTVLSGEMATVKQSARAANLTADEALAKANINTEGVAALDLETTDLFNLTADHELRIMSNTAKADAAVEQIGEHELKIATLETNDVGFISDIERIDAEIAAIEAETVLRNNTDIHVKDISTTTGTFKLDDPNRVIDKYDFSINGTSELTFTGDSVDFYTKPLTNIGTGGDLDTNAANIGDVKRIAETTNPDLTGYVAKMSDAPLNSIEMEFAAVGSTADEGLVLEGDTLYAKSSAGYQHFFIEDGKFNVKSKVIQNVRDAVDSKDAINKGQLDTVSAKASEADSLSKSNASRLDTVDTEVVDLQAGVTNATNLATGAQTSVDALSGTVGSNTAQIANNTKDIGDQSTLLDTVSDVANQADTLAKSNQSSITGLNSAVSSNATAISANASEIASVKTTAETTNVLAKSNQTELASKASQDDLNTVSGVADAADFLSKSNQAKLSNFISKDSDAEVNSLVNVTGNYNSTDNYDLKVNGTNVLSATQSAIYPKKNIVFQSGSALIKGVGDAEDDKDAMNKQSVEGLTNALGSRIDSLAAGTGDESDYVTVHGFDKLVSDHGDNVGGLLSTLDGDTQCHEMLNAIRASRPIANSEAEQWVMYEWVNASHDIWKFCPATGIDVKDGYVCVTHTKDLGCNITINTESHILCKQLYYHFGTGNNGRRNDWQTWHPRIKGYEGFNSGQVLSHGDISWTPTSNPRTNIQRIRDAMPNNCMWIGWHNPSAGNEFKIVCHGTSSTIESTTGTVLLYKRAGSSSTGGFYINTSTGGAEGWTRVYLGSANAWAAFDKQQNRSTGTSFTGVDTVTIPHLEDREDLKTYIIDTTQHLSNTSLTDVDGTYNSVGKYGVGWDGNWTEDWAYHNAYLNQSANIYIAFDYSNMHWRKFPVGKSHTQIGQPAVSSTLALLGERSLFPTDASVSVQLGNLEEVPHVSAEVTEIYDHDSKESTISFGGGRMWGYILGGGVPEVGTPEYPDGIHPIEGEV